MAHQWNSCFHNLQPLSAESRSLRVPLDSEETTYSSISPYSHMPWQDSKQLTDQDNLLKNGPNNLLDLVTDGLPSKDIAPSSTGNLNNIQQGCEMLNSSFLEEYSDVGGCSEMGVDKIRLSCRDIDSNLNPKSETQEIDSTKINSSLELSCSSPSSVQIAPLFLKEKFQYPTQSLNVCDTPSSVGRENLSDLAEENKESVNENAKEKKQMEKNHEDTVTQGHEVSDTAINTSTSGSKLKREIHSDSEKNYVDKFETSIQKHQLFVPLSGHSGALTTSTEEENLDGVLEEQHICIKQKQQLEATSFSQESYNFNREEGEVLDCKVKGKEQQNEVTMAISQKISFMRTDEEKDVSLNKGPTNSGCDELSDSQDSYLKPIKCMSTVENDRAASHSVIADGGSRICNTDVNGLETINQTLQSCLELPGSIMQNKFQYTIDKCSIQKNMGESDSLNKEQGILNPIDHSLELQNLKINRQLCLENKLCIPVDETESYSFRNESFLEQSRMLIEPSDKTVPCEESARESFQDVEGTDNQCLYGEPLSGEDSSCEVDFSDITTFEYSKFGDSLVNDNEHRSELSQLKLSVHMRKSLHPVVILETSDLRNSIEMYQCTACPHTAQNSDNLIEHHHLNHLLHNFKFCQTCDSYLTNNTQSEEHKCEVTDGIPQLSIDNSQKKKSRAAYHCKYCKQTFSRLYVYVQHVRTHTGETPYKCHACGSYFAQCSSLKKHKDVPGRCQPLNPLVQAPKPTSDVLGRRITEKLNVSSPNSPFINLTDCFVKLVDVCETHDKLKKHTYNLDKKSSSLSTRSVSKHQTNSEESEVTKTFPCPLCPRVFKYSYNCGRHLRECIKDFTLGGRGKIGNRYQCPLCYTNFTNPSNRHRHIKNTCLKEHCKWHLRKQTIPIKNSNQTKPIQSPNPSNQGFKCNFCPAVFSFASGKYRHMKKHDLFKRTGKVFKYKRSILNPMSNEPKCTEHCEETLPAKEASSSPSLACRFCGKCFGTTYSLKKHARNHKGERPYRCLICGKGFKQQAHLVSHKKVHQRRIQCTVCKKILPTIGELIKHRKSHLKRGMLQCPDCPLQFQYPAFLLRHMSSHKRIQEKSLELKQKVTQLKPQSVFKTFHKVNKKLLKCSICHEVCPNAKVLRSHCLLHISGPSSCQCPFCKRNFSSRHSLLRHMHIHTSEKSFTCRSCGKDFCRKENLRVHYKTCAKTEPKAAVIDINKIDGCKKPLRCSYCPRTFSRKPRLAKHHKGHISSTVKPCSKCGQFFWQNKYKAHERHCNTKINANMMCSCSHCGKTFPQEHDRKIHEINCNSIETKAMSRDNHQKNCPHCPMKFKYRTYLLRHIVSHTREKPFACMHCGHKFGKRTRCLQHEAFCDGVYKRKNARVKNVSTPRMLCTSSFKESKNKFQGESEGQYKCKFCTKSFIKARTLRLHIMTHTDAKPYCCKLCDSCFSRYDHLKLHQNRCQGKRLRLEVHLAKISPGDVGKGWQDKTDILNVAKQQGFECNQCSRSFSSQSNLGRHFSMLHASRPFSCSRCGSSFILEKYLKKHRRISKCQINNLKTNGSLKENGILKSIQTPSKQKHKYCCTYCPRFFKASEQLKVHTRLHTGDKPFCCENCSERFIRRDYLQRHLAKCNMRGESTDTVLCNKCGETFSTDTINNHRKSCVFHARSSGSKQSTALKQPMGFSCAYCSARFLLFSQLQQHFLNTHRDNTALMSPLKALPLQQELSSMVLLKEEPLDDSYDGTQLSSENDLRINQDLESDFEIVKPVPCPECNMRFANKGALKAHMRVHSGKYPFTCKKCSKGFWNKKNQQNHRRKCRTLRNVIEEPIYDSVDASEMDLTLKDSVLVFNKGSKTTGTGVLQTNFSCKDDSNGTTSQDTALNQGQVGSFKEKKAIEYQCSECDQSFTDGLLLISHLEDHGRVEQNQKRNTCHKCGKICASPGHLERHMKVHVNHEAHSCPECFKTFRSASVLEIHKLSHGKDGPDSEANVRNIFSCQVCKKRYSFRSSLVRHCRMRHSRDPIVLASLVKDKDDAKNVSTVKVYLNSESDTSPDEDNDGSSEDSDSDSAPYFPCHVCGKTFLTFESLEDHQRCHLGEKPHECAECGKCFFQAAQLQSHQRTHKTEFQCQTCGRGFVSLFALRKHKHTHGKSRPFRCSKCQLSFKGPSHLAEHMATHRNENFPCDLCGQTFSSKTSRAEHRKNHTVSDEIHPALDSLNERTFLPSPSESSSKLRVQPKYRCGVCNEHFRDTEQLSEHGCMAAKEQPYSCLDCDKHFFHQSHFEKHQLGHQQSTSYIYRCSKCHTTFSNHDSFLNHLKKHGDDEAKRELVEGTSEKGKEKATDNIYKCPMCSESYVLATELLSHLSLHSDNAHQCKICKLVYLSKTKLDEHAGCHLTAVTQFGCTECGQNFVSSEAFQQHPCSRQNKLTKASKHLHFSTSKSPDSLNQATMEEDDVDVDGEDFYKCPACFRQFSSQSKVLEHQNKHHASKKPFKCKLCGKAFVLNRYLKDHERRHRQKEKGDNKASLGAKQFKCPHCSVSEDSLKDLSLHLRIHAEEETGDLCCDMCDKSFNQLSLLRLHQESHVGQVVYECTECDKAFAFPYLLEDHQQTHSSL